MSYQAVLWDFGGVITSSPFEAFNRYEAERGLPLDFIRRVNATNPDTNAWAQFEASRIDIEAFDRLFLAESTAAGHPIPGREVIALLAGDVRPRMVEVLRRVKRDFRIACLTNNVRAGKGPGMSRSEESAAGVREAMALFEHVLESSREGLRKPQPEFYLRACQRLGVEPGRVVYLDDLGINLKPARELGMTTIKVVSEAQAVRELGTVLGIEL
ncbi:MAG: HAD family hydrolase [Porticoccaceae bacterium]|jgi:putative hydrolase of the HAD superfamily|nr:HAD family hydrolase [Porticoccaceae bacterium]